MNDASVAVVIAASSLHLLPLHLHASTDRRRLAARRVHKTLPEVSKVTNDFSNTSIPCHASTDRSTDADTHINASTHASRNGNNTLMTAPNLPYHTVATVVNTNNCVPNVIE